MTTMRKIFGSTALAAAAAIGCTAALADAPQMGRAHYEAKCAVCHGDNGKGDGPVANMLTQKPSDLTMMSKNNDGVFPFWTAYEIVDGRKGVGAHGTREMPVWGKEFYQASRGGGQGISAETIVRGQIMELLIYLRSIQQ
jgi:mono/diheme cytochrome c family protein